MPGLSMGAGWNSSPHANTASAGSTEPSPQSFGETWMTSSTKGIYHCALAQSSYPTTFVQQPSAACEGAWGTFSVGRSYGCCVPTWGTTTALGPLEQFLKCRQGDETCGRSFWLLRSRGNWELPFLPILCDAGPRGTSSDPPLLRNSNLIRITVGKKKSKLWVTKCGILPVLSTQEKNWIRLGLPVVLMKKAIATTKWAVSLERTEHQGSDSQGPCHLGSVNKARISPLLTPFNKTEAHWKPQTLSACSLQNDSLSGRAELPSML